MVHPRDTNWAELEPAFPEYRGTRQIFVVDLTLILNSCGYGVPLYDLVAERPTLNKWADKKGKKGIKEYWDEKNRLSLNGQNR